MTLQSDEILPWTTIDHDGRTAMAGGGFTRGTVTRIGQGTWYIEQAQRVRAIEALRGGLDRGLSHIDTAEMYGDGRSEEIVGEAIAGRRDEVFLVSKVLPHNASRAGTIAACEASLKRLRTDRLDCYLLHWRGSYPLEETFEAFERLKQAGKILSWGVSNFDVEDLEEALDVAGEGKIACNQVLYHLQERAIEHAVIPWCEANGVTVTAYSPFGHDDFPEPDSAGGRVLAEIATARGATPRQVALAFLTRRPSVVAIPKAATPRNVEDNAGALTLALSPEENERIDAAFPRGRRPRSLPML
jgi:diketogulonate reductase-like aldo/keto reductase